MRPDALIRVGKSAPPEGKQMGVIACVFCGEKFVIVHHLKIANPGRAERQAHRYRWELSREHDDQHFKNHLDFYEGLEDE